MEPILPHQPPYICCRCRSKKRTTYKNTELIREESSQLLTSSIFLAGKNSWTNKKQFLMSLFRPTRMETSFLRIVECLFQHMEIYQNWPKKNIIQIFYWNHTNKVVRESPTAPLSNPLSP
jgi:hypothetical protein